LRGRRGSGEESVDAVGDHPGDAVGRREFALSRDGGEQPRGVPAVPFGVEQPPGDRAPRGVRDEGAANVVAERGDGRALVAGVRVMLGGVQVAGDEGGERSGFLLGQGNRLGGGQRGGLVCQGVEEDFASGVVAGSGAGLVDAGVVVGEMVVGGDVEGGGVAGAAGQDVESRERWGAISHVWTPLC
jgi:hypothetical protein